jgi:hypothetical protein
VASVAQRLEQPSDVSSIEPVATDQRIGERVEEASILDGIHDHAAAIDAGEHGTRRAGLPGGGRQP